MNLKLCYVRNKAVMPSMSRVCKKKIIYFSVLPWYMWKNIGTPSFHWKLKHVCQDFQRNDTCEVENFLQRDYGK